MKPVVPRLTIQDLENAEFNALVAAEKTEELNAMIGENMSEQKKFPMVNERMRNLINLVSIYTNPDLSPPESFESDRQLYDLTARTCEEEISELEQLLKCREALKNLYQDLSRVSAIDLPDSVNEAYDAAKAALEGK